MKFKLLLYIIILNVVAFGQVTSPPIVEYTPQKSIDEIKPNRPKSTRERLREGDFELDEKVNPRSFEPNFQEKYSSSEYDYNRTKPRESVWNKIKNRLADLLSKFFRNSDIRAINDVTLWVMRILAVGIIGLVLYWFLNYVFKKDGNWIFSKKDKKLTPEVRKITENIHEIDLDALISKYQTEKNYRFAIRYQYLKLLKVFNDKELLTWDPDKTNLDYIQELKSSPHSSSFIRLTHVFDYVWYGDFAVDEEAYARYKNEFHSLIKNYE